jgi:hypothetical protein
MFPFTKAARLPNIGRDWIRGSSGTSDLKYAFDSSSGLGIDMVGTIRFSRQEGSKSKTGPGEGRIGNESTRFSRVESLPGGAGWPPQVTRSDSMSRP